MDKLQIIEKKIKFYPQRIYRLIAKQAGMDINGLSEPCYKIKTKLFQHILYRELNVSEKEWKAFANESENTLGPKGKGNTYRVPFTYALTYLYYRFVRLNKAKMAETVLLYMLIKFYGSSYEKFFPEACQDPIFRYTIDNIVKVHLFYREKTIANALLFLSKYTQRKFFNRIKSNTEWYPELMHDFMHDSRQKINQSSRSFANAYYNNAANGKGIAIEVDSDDEGENKNMFQTTTGASGSSAAVEKFIKSMFVYKNYNRKTVEEAKKRSRIKSNLAENIISLIHERSSEENVKIILTSFLKQVLDTKTLCGPEFYKTVGQLMHKRNLKDSFIFKNLVITFADSLYENVSSTTHKANTRDKISVRIFVAFYLTISFRNLFC